MIGGDQGCNAKGIPYKADKGRMLTPVAQAAMRLVASGKKSSQMPPEMTGLRTTLVMLAANEGKALFSGSVMSRKLWGTDGSPGCSKLPRIFSASVALCSAPDQLPLCT